MRNFTVMVGLALCATQVSAQFSSPGESLTGEELYGRIERACETRMVSDYASMRNTLSEQFAVSDRLTTRKVERAAEEMLNRFDECVARRWDIEVGQKLERLADPLLKERWANFAISRNAEVRSARAGRIAQMFARGGYRASDAPAKPRHGFCRIEVMAPEAGRKTTFMYASPIFTDHQPESEVPGGVIAGVMSFPMSTTGQQVLAKMGKWIASNRDEPITWVRQECHFYPKAEQATKHFKVETDSHDVIEDVHL